MNKDKNPSAQAAEKGKAGKFISSLSAVAQVSLLERSKIGSVFFTFPRDNSFLLEEGSPVTLDEQLTPGHSFSLRLCRESSSGGEIPLLVIELNADGEFAMAEEALDNGWQTGRDFYTIHTSDSFTATIRLTAPAAENGEQDIIIVGTVPTP